MSLFPPLRTEMPNSNVFITISLGTPLHAEICNKTISATPRFANLA